MNAMEFQEYRILFGLFIVIIIVGSVTPKAVFEIDLLKYEAQPHKCCDGYKFVKIGPAKCSECDPYFRICMNHIPNGPSQCVTTTRENNVHATDLTHGNIQPNHLAMNLDTLQGSLSVDVDIKDYDSTTKDDDIDHLFYTFASIPSPEKITVVLNGTRVRLTIALLVTCQTNYHGPDCDIYCVNGSNYICSWTGERICKTGFSGENCEIKVESTTARTTDTIETTSKTHHPQTLNPKTTRALQFTESQTIQAKSTTSGLISKWTTMRNKSDPETQSQTAPPKTLEPVQLTESSQTKESDMANTVTQMPENATRMFSAQETRMSTARTETVKMGVSRVQDGSKQNSNSVPTEASKTMKPISYRIPEPLEIYSCNMMIEGHKVGLHQPVEEIVTTVLSHNMTELQTISVHVMSSTFETTDNGVAVTDVSFIVRHHGDVLTAVEVSKRLYSPASLQLLTSHLQAKSLKQHSSPTTAASTYRQRDNIKHWVKNHLPFVIVISCVVGICFIVFAVILGRSINRRRPSSDSKKTKFPKSVKYNEDQTFQMFSNKLSFDTPFALDNPLYDFSCDQLQPSDGSHV